MQSPNDTTKACTKCGVVKPLDGFNRHKRGRLGRGQQCRSCISDHMRAYTAATAEAHRAKVAAWRKANPDKVKAYIDARYHERDAARAIAEEARAQATQERAARTEAAREALAAKKTDGTGYNRAQYLANREQYIAWSAAYRKAHPEIYRKASQEWRDRNPDKVRKSNAVRRARERNAPVVTPIDRATIWDRDNGICHLCGQPCDPSNWHLEHLMPLARGGSHAPDNVAVSHPSCNRRKHANIPGHLRATDES